MAHFNLIQHFVKSIFDLRRNVAFLGQCVPIVPLGVILSL